MPIQKLKKFLDSHQVQYLLMDHEPAYTARETAASATVPRREFAKAVMVRLDGVLAMAVVPASRRVDLERLSRLANASTATLASEDDFRESFPDCEIGAMPPFGNLYEMDVYASDELMEDDDIVFNAGSHTQAMRLAVDDYRRLVKPKVADIAARE
jgi:Ala-tRNA(Pro) deacylase